MKINRIWVFSKLWSIFYCHSGLDPESSAFTLCLVPESIRFQVMLDFQHPVPHKPTKFRKKSTLSVQITK